MTCGNPPASYLNHLVHLNKNCITLTSNVIKALCWHLIKALKLLHFVAVASPVSTGFACFLKDHANLKHPGKDTRNGITQPENDFFPSHL